MRTKGEPNKCQKATAARVIVKPKNQRRKLRKFWQQRTRQQIPDHFNLPRRKANEMKKTLGLAFILISFLTNAQAKQFSLSEADDAYISLNECLYALSKGTRLSSSSGDIFIYQTQVWQIFFSDDQKYVCNLIGKLTE